jgi:membrane fusion protein (multidrug efflux system)
MPEREDSAERKQDQDAGSTDKPEDDKSRDGEAAGADEDNGDNKEPDDKKEPDGKSSEPEKPPLYKRPIFWIVVGIVAAVLIIGGVLFYLHARKYESTDDAFIDTHIVRIAAQTDGRLSQVADLDNLHVRKGQLLAVIEPGTPATARQQALATVAEADAEIGQAMAQLKVARANLEQARASARAPLAEARRAAADYARYLKLRSIDPLAAAATQVDQARAQSNSGAGQAQAARAQIDTARANILAAGRQIGAAQARRDAAQAQVRQASVTVSYTTIRAPIDGQMVQRQVNVGSYVAPGQQLMAIVPDDVWITANFKETQLTHMRPGQPARIKIDAFPDQTFPGHVVSIQRGAGQAFQLLPPQNATGNYVKVVQRVPVRIRFDNGDWRRFVIGPGMSVEPTVKIR